MSVLALLDRPTYLYAEVDRLVGLHPGTARRWINGYERDGRYYEPILRTSAQGTEWVTWGEFVEARMLAEFRDQSIRTAKLRAAVDKLRERFNIGYPLAHLQPYLAATDGELAIKDEKGDALSVIRTGQLILQASRPVIDTATLASDDSGRKFASEILLDREFPGIKVNPDRLSGQPTFEGRRIAVMTIASMVAAGEPRDELAADYSLSLVQVDEAVRYADKHKLVA